MKGKAISSIGKVRSANEDFFGMEETGHPFYMVADGMGGHKGGAVASKEAVKYVSDHLQKNLSPDISGKEVENILYQSVISANEIIFEKSQRENDCNGMGTTLTVAVPVKKEQKIYFAHIGDSRAYIIEDAGIVQVTEDHSLVQELVINGDITEEQAKAHPKRNVITRALGTDTEVQPDIFSVDFAFEAGHHLLLCTDGLSNAVEEELMKRIIEGSESIESACAALVNEANARGGKDNITVLVLKGA